MPVAKGIKWILMAWCGASTFMCADANKEKQPLVKNAAQIKIQNQFVALSLSRIVHTRQVLSFFFLLGRAAKRQVISQA